MPKHRKFMGAYISGADFFKMMLVGGVGYEALAWGGPGASFGQERPATGQRKPRARQRWTDSPGRGLESQFRLGARFLRNAVAGLGGKR